MLGISELMQSYVDVNGLETLEGIVPTAIKGVNFYRVSHGSGRQPLTYQSGIIVMGKGHKTIHLGEQSVCYGPGDYLVIGVPMPLECEAFSRPGESILGISIDVDSQLLHALVNQLAEAKGGQQYGKDITALDLGISSQSYCDVLEESFKRLLLAMLSEVEAQIIGESIVKEIIYRILIGKNGHVLFDLARHDGHYARIAKVLNRIHKEYSNALTVEGLAEQANMSLSGFHKAFRQVTAESPLQYLKKIRLNKARELIQNEGRRASDAAMLVGYSSASQFSREFKRHFNATPKSMSA